MKTIIYASNNFQFLLCVQAISDWMQAEDGLLQKTAFDGKIKLYRNTKSVTARYMDAKDTIVSYRAPKEEFDDKQLKLEYD